MKTLFILMVVVIIILIIVATRLYCQNTSLRIENDQKDLEIAKLKENSLLNIKN